MAGEKGWYERLKCELEQLSKAEEADVQELTDQICGTVNEVEPESVSQFVAADTIVMEYFGSCNRENFEPLLKRFKDCGLVRLKKMSPDGPYAVKVGVVAGSGGRQCWWMFYTRTRTGYDRSYEIDVCY